MKISESLLCTNTLTVLATVILTAPAVAQEWRQLPPPLARADFAMACDTGAGTTVLFGGRDIAGARLADTWLFDGLGWRGVPTPVAPPARQLHAMAFDPRRGRVVLFGGFGTAGALADTWEFDVAQLTWTQVTPVSSPGPRSSHGMTYDATLGCIVLWGGSGATGFLTDTWTYDGTDWTRVPTQTSPPTRSGFAMAYDPARGRTMLFGGNWVITRFDDTWEFDGTNWAEVPVLARPPARMNHALATDSARSTVVLFGGFAASTLGDTWDATAASRRGGRCRPGPRRLHVPGTPWRSIHSSAASSLSAA
ncbi:MAG: hypothetical protein IPM29_28140 [Planctomycetes bacterium]|nr:hypothetical protein [Planctomycetota bacterium]